MINFADPEFDPIDFLRKFKQNLRNWGFSIQDLHTGEDGATPQEHLQFRADALALIELWRINGYIKAGGYTHEWEFDYGNK